MIYGRRKFRSQTSDNMDRWKSRGGKSQREEEQKRERMRRKKMQVREKVAKSRNTVFFQWFVAPEGRKVGSLKRRVRSHVARWEMKNCTPLWREVHFEVKMHKTHHSRSTFPSWYVEKVHAIVARSTCGSQNVQNTPCLEHFWKLRCWKSARRCDAKHISKSKVLKTDGLGPLLDVQMSFRMAGARDCAQKWAKRVAVPTTTTATPHSTTTTTTTTLHYTALITLHYATLHCTTLRYTTQTATTTTLPYITLHYVHTPPQMQLQLHQLHYTKTTTPLHYNYSCATPHYIQQLWVRWPTRWPLQPLQPFQKNTTPTTFQSISGFALPSVIHNNQPPYRFPIVETSTTALCGTTGIIYINIFVYIGILHIYIDIYTYIYIYILAI